MDEYDKYKEFLDFLEYKEYSWGDINRFMAFYKNLNLNAREKFNSATPASARYCLMNLYISRFFREVPAATNEQKKDLVQEVFYYVSLDNFDFDYRETVIRLQGVFDKVKEATIMVREVWAKLSEEMPHNTVSQVNRLVSSI